jgi:hypothetical protein
VGQRRDLELDHRLLSLIVTFGFPVAVPLFVLAYSNFYGASWQLGIALSSIAWDLSMASLTKFSTSLAHAADIFSVRLSIPSIDNVDPR